MHTAVCSSYTTTIEQLESRHQELREAWAVMYRWLARQWIPSEPSRAFETLNRILCNES